MHRVREVVLLTVCAITLGACGDKGALEDKGAASGTKDDVASAAEREQVPSEDSAALVRLARKYVRAVPRGDFRSACQTLSREQRRAFATTAGSCAQALARQGDLGVPDGAEVRENDVFLDGDVAVIPVRAPGGGEPVATLMARREGGRFRLIAAKG